MKPKFRVFLNVEKPVKDVFDAVYNPKKLMRYFTTKYASAPLVQGTTVYWDFADFPGKFPVHVKKSVPHKRIVLAWQAQDGHYNTQVEMIFKRLGPRQTHVAISESGWRETSKAVASSYGNCMGWTHMLCCLKAYLEYGINLRKNSFK